MIRSTLNLYLDGFLSLAADKKSSRLVLIEEALSADSPLDLLREWIWIQELDHAAALKLKLWFQLSYSELSQLFGPSGLSVREVSQMLRNQRVLLLPGYRPASFAGSGPGEISCFMVEQHLSPLMDGELIDAKTLELMQRHFEICGDCRTRLFQFRDLQTLILQSRTKEPEIDEKEWDFAMHHLKRLRRDQILKIFAFTLGLLLIVAFLAWAIFSKPEKMPNVYEIP